MADPSGIQIAKFDTLLDEILHEVDHLHKRQNQKREYRRSIALKTKEQLQLAAIPASNANGTASSGGTEQTWVVSDPTEKERRMVREELERRRNEEEKRRREAEERRRRRRQEEEEEERRRAMEEAEYKMKRRTRTEGALAKMLEKVESLRQMQQEFGVVEEPTSPNNSTATNKEPLPPQLAPISQSPTIAPPTSPEVARAHSPTAATSNLTSQKMIFKVHYFDIKDAQYGTFGGNIGITAREIVNKIIEKHKLSAEQVRNAVLCRTVNGVVAEIYKDTDLPLLSFNIASPDTKLVFKMVTDGQVIRVGTQLGPPPTASAQSAAANNNNNNNNVVLFEGPLKVRGRPSDEWQDRYFVLRPHHLDFYLIGEDGRRLEGSPKIDTVPLTGCTFHKKDEKDRNNRLFNIYHPPTGCSLYFRGDNPKEANDWIEMLKKSVTYDYVWEEGDG